MTTNKPKKTTPRRSGRLTRQPDWFDPGNNDGKPLPDDYGKHEHDAGFFDEQDHTFKAPFYVPRRADILSSDSGDSGYSDDDSSTGHHGGGIDVLERRFSSVSLASEGSSYESSFIDDTNEVASVANSDASYAPSSDDDSSGSMGSLVNSDTE